MARLDPLYFIASGTEVQDGSVWSHDPGENLELPLWLAVDYQPFWDIIQIFRCRLCMIGRLGQKAQDITSVACIGARGFRWWIQGKNCGKGVLQQSTLENCNYIEFSTLWKGNFPKLKRSPFQTWPFMGVLGVLGRFENVFVGWRGEFN